MVDLGPILYGELSDKEDPHPSSPIDTAFTRENIMEAYHKLGFDPHKRAILKNKTLRHELGQGEETQQTKTIRKLEKEYNRLKQVVDREGKLNSLSCKTLCVFFVVLRRGKRGTHF